MLKQIQLVAKVIETLFCACAKFTPHVQSLSPPKLLPCYRDQMQKIGQLNGVIIQEIAHFVKE